MMKIFDASADDHDFTTWQVMQEYLPRELLSDYRNTFNSFDRNKSGLIKIEDATGVLNRMGHKMPVHDVQKVLHDIVGMECNEAAIKYVDFTEYVAIMSAVATNCVPEYEMLLVFREFDRDGDGYISPHELKDLLTRLGDDISEGDLQDMMQEADRDGDGKVSYNEFVRVMTNSIETDGNIPSSGSSDLDNISCCSVPESSRRNELPCRSQSSSAVADSGVSFGIGGTKKKDEKLRSFVFGSLRKKSSSKFIINNSDANSDGSTYQKKIVSSAILNKLHRAGSKNELLRNAFKRRSKRRQQSD